MNCARPPAAVNALYMRCARSGPKYLSFCGVDPQRRNARSLAECCERVDQRVLAAHVVIGARAAAAREIDDGHEPRRRIGCQRDAGETACGMSDRDHSLRRDVEAILHGIDRGAQIADGGAGGNTVIAAVAGPAVFRIVAAGIAIAAAHHHQRRETATRELARLRIKAIGRHLRTLAFVARRAMADQRQRITPRAGRPDQYGFEAARSRGRHRNAQLLAVQFVGRRGGYRRRKRIASVISARLTRRPRRAASSVENSR